MASTLPFFYHVAHATGIMSPAPEPERFPFHDNDECPVGLDIKAGGQWQYYEPHSPEEERVKCPICAELDRLGR